MEDPYERSNNGELETSNLQIVRYAPFKPFAKAYSTWFDLRVFYVRISNFQVDDSTPEFLTLYHVPLSPDTVLEVNGMRQSMISDDGVSVLLKRNRVDKKSEEVTFVSTDSVRTSGAVKFQVFDKEVLVLSGVLEMSNNNESGRESRNAKRWSMTCESEFTAGSGFLKGKHNGSSESLLPTIEVYFTGCFSGKPVILTKTLQLGYRKKHNKMGFLDSIPEHETVESPKKVSPENENDLQVSVYRNGKLLNEDYYNHNSMYWRRTEYMDNEDGELSWFNAGVRVGVGIGLGICLGLGVGVGLLVRSYQSTTRNFKRRFL